MKYVNYIDFSFAEITVVEEDEHIVGLYFEKQIGELKETKILMKAMSQLEEYFNGERKIFDLPIKLIGTEFQKKVWRALCDVPYGETRSYSDIAKAVGNKKAARAVGMANNKNPISIIIPCHRVIGADGKMVGYGGGIDKKVFLLDLEKKYAQN